MKFVYFTDAHIKGVNPKSRKDNFPKTIMEKLKEVGEIAKEIDATAILCGGDLFDRPDTHPSIVKSVCQIFKSYPCPIYGVAGNHDIYAYNPDTIKRTMLGVLDGAGLYNLLSFNEPITIYNDSENSWPANITGQHSHYQLDKDGEISHYCPPCERSGTNIHIVHGFLTNHKWPEGVAHTIIDQIVDKTSADIILAGHEHSGFGVIKRNGKIFCNPGALGRVSASVGDVNRDVCVAIIEINQHEFDVILRPLKCAKPADEVLDREKLEEEKRQQTNIEKYIEKVSNFEVQATNLIEVMEWIAKKENEEQGSDVINEAVLNEARKRIEVAQEKVGRNIN